MKSNKFLTCASAIALSTLCMNAAQAKIFVGVTLGAQHTMYNNDFENKNLNAANGFIAFGADTGIRFGSYDEIYNAGFSLNFDTTNTEQMKRRASDHVYANIRTHAWTANFENFIRLSGNSAKRIDLILGAGLGAIDYSIKSENVNVTDEKIWSTALAAKTGFGFTLTKHLTLDATVRVFVPTRQNYAIATYYIGGISLRYMF